MRYGGEFIDRVPHPQGGEEGAILEVFSVSGDTIAVVTVPLSSIEALREDDVLSVQRLMVGVGAVPGE